jgi:hypothetical protein
MLVACEGTIEIESLFTCAGNQSRVSRKVMSGNKLTKLPFPFQTEPDVVLAPNDFWNYTLRSNLENELSKLQYR